MKNLFTGLHDSLKNGQDCVLSTIIADSGSTPRGAGARMLALSDGRSLGTIGGGAVEYRAQQIAQELLKSRQSAVKAFELNPSDVANIGMICGGSVRVYFQYIAGTDAATRALCEDVLAAYGENRDAWLVTDITDETVWSMELYSAGQEKAAPYSGQLTHRARQLRVGDQLYYAEPLVRAGMVYIFGGGHVAQALVPVLSGLDFRCVLFEDREEFVRCEDFPGAVACILGRFEDIGSKVAINAQDYVVVMTRGHMFDYAVQVQALRRKPRYLGVIGSRSKVKALREKMIAEEGFAPAEVDTIHSPIGLDIGSETPAEIAISIAAQLIQVRAQTKGN